MTLSLKNNLACLCAEEEQLRQDSNRSAVPAMFTGIGGGSAVGPLLEDQRESRRMLNALRPLIEGWLSMATSALIRGEVSGFVCGELQLIGGKEEHAGAAAGQPEERGGVMAALSVSSMDHYLRMGLDLLAQALNALWSQLKRQRETAQEKARREATHETQDSEMDDGFEALLAGIPLDGSVADTAGPGLPLQMEQEHEGQWKPQGKDEDVSVGATDQPDPLTTGQKATLENRRNAQVQQFVSSLYNDVSGWLMAFARGRQPRDHGHRLPTSLFLPAVDCLALSATILAAHKVGKDTEKLCAADGEGSFNACICPQKATTLTEHCLQNIPVVRFVSFGAASKWYYNEDRNMRHFPARFVSQVVLARGEEFLAGREGDIINLWFLAVVDCESSDETLKRLTAFVNTLPEFTNALCLLPLSSGEQAAPDAIFKQRSALVSCFMNCLQKSLPASRKEANQRVGQRASPAPPAFLPPNTHTPFLRLDTNIAPKAAAVQHAL